MKVTKAVYYGVMIEDGVGDICEGHDYKKKNESWYLQVYIDKNKPELGYMSYECFSIFHIINDKILYVSL